MNTASGMYNERNSYRIPLLGLGSTLIGGIAGSGDASARLAALYDWKLRKWLAGSLGTKRDKKLPTNMLFLDQKRNL